MNPLHDAAACESRGAAVIEMALIAPVLALGVIGIVDVSNAYSKKLALEQGAQRAIEKIMNTTETTTVEATLANEAVCQVDGHDRQHLQHQPDHDEQCDRDLAPGLHGFGRSCHHEHDHDFQHLRRHVRAPAAPRAARYVQVTVTDKYTPVVPDPLCQLQYNRFNLSLLRDRGREDVMRLRLRLAGDEGGAAAVEMALPSRSSS